MRALPRQPPAESVEASKVMHDEQNSTPSGGPHHELGRLQLKIWSKSDFSIAQTGQHTCACLLVGLASVGNDAVKRVNDCVS